jgi:hypothetical protein
VESGCGVGKSSATDNIAAMPITAIAWMPATSFKAAMNSNVNL